MFIEYTVPISMVETPCTPFIVKILYGKQCSGAFRPERSPYFLHRWRYYSAGYFIFFSQVETWVPRWQNSFIRWWPEAGSECQWGDLRWAASANEQFVLHKIHYNLNTLRGKVSREGGGGMYKIRQTNTSHCPDKQTPHTVLQKLSPKPTLTPLARH